MDALALPIPISSTIRLTAIAAAGTDSEQATDFDSQAATTNPLGPISVNAQAIDGTQTATAFGNGSAIWLNSAAGSVDFNIGWIASPGTFGAVGFTSTSDREWEYRFTADQDGTFELGWDVTGTASPNDFGVHGFLFGWSGSGGLTQLGLGTTGSLSRDLMAGMTYTVFLEAGPNISGGIGGRSLDLVGNFDWQITQIPEPATLALIGMGLAGLGFSRRKQKLN